MSSNLPPVPHTSPMLDFNGFITPIWNDWFRKVFQRAGGNIAETNDELAVVGTSKITDLAVTTAKIDDLAVTAAKIAVLAVTTAKLDDLSVTTQKIASNSVNYGKLASSEWVSSAAASGYFRLTSGLYVQWGITGAFATATSTSVSFPISFPTGCLQVFASIRDNSAVATTATGQWGTGGYSTTAFSLYNRTSVTHTFNWIAVGY